MNQPYYNDPESCKLNNVHLTNVDEDGYCNNCGHSPEEEN